MKEINIKLSSVQDIREFVNVVILADYDVDLVQGRYTIDAKSIMGIFSLDLLSVVLFASLEASTPVWHTFITTPWMGPRIAGAQAMS